MRKIKFRYFIVAIAILFGLTACTLPGFSTPTPFSFPTPDKTMTALFEPTQDVAATSAADGDSDTSTNGDGQDAGDEEKDLLTETPESTVTTEVPTATEEPAETAEPTANSYVGPAVRSGPSIIADFMDPNSITDGDLSDWNLPIQKVITHVVYGAGEYDDEDDISGTVVAGWDNNFLYLGVRVKDDKYVQQATKEQIYLGDSIEILFDRYVSDDYNLQAMTSDDYQIGISPGECIGTCVISLITIGKVASPLFPGSTPIPTSLPNTFDPPDAYIWFPKTEAGRTTDIKIGAVGMGSGSGYQIEFKIPWDLLGVSTPAVGDHYGFAISINDNDNVGDKEQQTMVSNVPTRNFADPTTWGDLYLQ
ncbi:MAG: sugar-binding protein [Anaerolineales bacterium]